MIAEALPLLTPVPSVRFGRQRTVHGYKLHIEDQRIVLKTRCGIDTTDTEYDVTHRIVTCDDCLTVDR